MQGMEESFSGSDVIVEIANRLRILESKQSLHSERLLVMNQNMIEEYKKLIKDIRNIESEIRALKVDLQNVKTIMKHLTEEASAFAKKDEIQLLEKYIKMWNPLNFVTETDINNILERKLKDLNLIKKERKK